jgi:hypothetical protein
MLTLIIILRSSCWCLQRNDRDRNNPSFIAKSSVMLISCREDIQYEWEADGCIEDEDECLVEVSGLDTPTKVGVNRPHPGMRK